MLALNFDPITLDEMDQVKLMNRYDHKFWFHIDKLMDILQEINEDYYILNIDGTNLLSYATVYYDTAKSSMYTKHHNGKKNRYKVRRRTYVNSDIQFLELKFKNNKGKTQKNRILTKNPMLKLNQEEKDFIKENTPYDGNNLEVSLYNEFTRITLVNKNFEERCTIDLNIKFRNNERSLTLDNMAVVEIKSDRGSSPSLLKLALRRNRLKSNGFSKYCIGSAFVSDKKQNNFKPQLRAIEKTILTEPVQSIIN